MIAKKIYNWDTGTIREAHYADANDHCPIVNHPTPMPPEILVPEKIVDATTWETIPAVLAYNEMHGLLDRHVLGDDGNSFLNAAGTGVAVTTERRRIQIIPGRPKDA